MAERRIRMRKNMGVLVFLLCLPFSFSLLGSCAEEEERDVMEKSRLRVTSPNKLKGVYRCAMGSFGVPQYGGTMAGTVVYPKANSKACNSFQDFDISFKSKKQRLPTFVLVDREECVFAMKAWNAQNAGAAAILVVDDKLEQLITMGSVPDDYINNITIPSVLINKSLGDRIKKALSSGDTGVQVNLDWREALPHPDNRVEYEFWIDSNDECGPMCDNKKEFVKQFKGAAQIMEQKGYTRFAPHYISWSYCLGSFRKDCKSQCINHGRYCVEADSTRGYDGKDVVVQNLRQACFFKVANESGKPWLWWDYVTDFTIRCPMKENKYTNECSNQVIQSLGMDIKKIESCVGDIEADVENPILEAEEKARIGKGSRRDVTVLPTLVINDREYRGKLNKGAVLKAICSGFKETTEPAICLSEEIETNECRQENNGGCWQDKVAKITACKDTFRGKVCECPTVRGIKLVGDGYTICKLPSNITTISWGVIGVIILGLVVALGVVVYVGYKYKIRRDMDSEIREILTQYIPLDKQGGFPNQIHLKEVV